jgi:hypothetical protein
VAAAPTPSFTSVCFLPFSPLPLPFLSFFGFLIELARFFWVYQLPVFLNIIDATPACVLLQLIVV